MPGDMVTAALAAAYVIAVGIAWAHFKLEESDTEIGRKMRRAAEIREKEYWRHH